MRDAHRQISLANRALRRRGAFVDPFAARAFEIEAGAMRRRPQRGSPSRRDRQIGCIEPIGDARELGECFGQHPAIRNDDLAFDELVERTPDAVDARTSVRAARARDSRGRPRPRGNARTRATCARIAMTETT
jgi:hypothetical protein